jgi:hypothetical protein
MYDDICINVNSRCALNVLFTGVSVNSGVSGFPGKRQSCQKNIYLYVQAVLCEKSMKYINVVSKEKKQLRGVKIYLMFIRVKSAKN